MLKTMRHHAKYFYVLFFIVILTFIFWGVGTVDQSDKVDIVAEVGKHKITGEEYRRSYDNATRIYREIYKEKFDEDMRKKLKFNELVLNSLVDNRVLLIVAERAGITITDDELSEAIVHEPAFFKDGTFSNEIYNNRLRLMNLTPDGYEPIKRKELIIQKISRLIELSAGTPDNELSSMSGNEETLKAIKEAIAKDAKEKAIKAYIEGVKKDLKITINTQLIS
jgi:hypothetical protein